MEGNGDNVNPPPPNVSGDGNVVRLSPELQKVLDSLNKKQRRIYDASPTKIDALELILEERKKSESRWELMSVSIYTITTVIITLINALFFSSEDSTKSLS
ncbi:hypothetical protein C1645_878886 [Glomus cerebriforme]|uniref:Transmembrane protein n=1 Tax=Glomus cerebriforme TaxID=658196 RepID=A0A397SQ93_9GLOM|nr:hypothetical protein C1645_878886 [Glomus cerebriforme]